MQETVFFFDNPAVENKKMPLKTTGRAPRFLLLMPDDLRQAIDRAAAVHGRTVTAEINMRLKESLKPPEPGIAPSPISYPTVHPSNGAPVKTESPAYVVTNLDQAMLAIFHAMPVEKQLALLSLLK